MKIRQSADGRRAEHPGRTLHDTLFLLDLDFDHEVDRGAHSDLFSAREPHPPLCKIPPVASSYRPRSTRGDGPGREGYCERCDQWFRLKTSSYWYHMNYKHGISASGKVFPEPELRDRDLHVEGFCRECSGWVVLGTSRRSVRFGWFRHWQKNHCKGRSI